jgi:hypothetical protein
MDPIYYALIAGAVIAVVITLTVVVKHRGEKVQNDLHSDNQQDALQAEPIAEADEGQVGAAQVDNFMLWNEVDHNDFEREFLMLGGQYAVHVQDNTPIGSLLDEHLYILRFKIGMQIGNDEEFVHHLSLDQRNVIAQRHKEWRDIQERISSMLEWKPAR